MTAMRAGARLETEASAPNHSAAAMLVALLVTTACSDWEDTSVPGGDGNISGSSGSATGGTGGSGSGGSATGGGTATMAGSGSCGLPPFNAPELPRGLHVVGNELRDSRDQVVRLRGVNRSGSEYACMADSGYFDGPTDNASIRALLTWNVNAVRIPLNEACWLGINGASPRFSGAGYQSAIQDYVSRLEQHGIVPILELHRAAPAEFPASKLYPMPNADHTPTFWREVATLFLKDDAVIFEPYNEPFPDGNRDTDAAWKCWRDGCTIPESKQNGVVVFPQYEAVGMQELVSTIRSTGAKQHILLGGVQFSNSLSQFMAYAPQDSAANIAPAWHVYNFNACSNASCWNVAPTAVAAQLPLFATEIGQNDCKGTMVTPLMQWLDARGANYLAWWWNVSPAACTPASSSNPGDGPPFSLVTDYLCPLPKSGFAQAIYDHFTRSAP